MGEQTTQRSQVSARPVVMLTEVLRRAVLNPAGEPIGRLEDLIVRLGESGYPPVTGLKVKIGGRDLFIGSELIEKLEPGDVRLRHQTVNLGRFERRPGEVLLRSDVQGHHLVDVAAGRIVRAHDLALSEVDGQWSLVGVDRSPRHLIRRFLPRATPVRTKPREYVLDWKHIQPFVGHVPTAKLLMPPQRLRRLHPAQIADLVENSSPDEGEEIIHAIASDTGLTADVFEELDTKHQLELLESRTNEEAALVLAQMAPHVAADLIQELEQERRLPVLNLMPAQLQHKIRALFMYHPTSAGGLMNPDFLAVTRGTTVGVALARIRTDDRVPHQLLTTVFVTETDGRLIGRIAVVDLLKGDSNQLLEEMPGLSVPSVNASADLSDVTLLMADFNLTALAVTDGDGILIGAISIDDLVEAMIPDDWRRRAEVSTGA